MIASDFVGQVLGHGGGVEVLVASSQLETAGRFHLIFHRTIITTDSGLLIGVISNIILNICQLGLMASMSLPPSNSMVICGGHEIGPDYCWHIYL